MTADLMDKKIAFAQLSEHKLAEFEKAVQKILIELRQNTIKILPNDATFQIAMKGARISANAACRDLEVLAHEMWRAATRLKEDEPGVGDQEL